MPEDYSRRRRKKAPGSNDDFDWDAFDRETSGLSDNAPIQRRRRRSASAPAEQGRASLADSMNMTDTGGTDDVFGPSPAPSGTGRRRRRNPQAAATGSGSISGNMSNPAPVSKRRKKRGRKQLTEKQRKFRRKLRIGILSSLLILIVVISGMFVGMYAAVSREIKEMKLESLALNNNSMIYYLDSNGNAKEYETLKSESNRIWVESDKIAPGFKDAIVSIEDERFYKHHGVDIKRTVGATFGYLMSKVGIGSSSYGGSTITQQVIKNITQEDDFKATRKIKEMMRAIALEKELSKDQILTMYCNIVYFANNCNGVEAAAKFYFDKSASDLNLQEAASIAGITQFPSEYDPVAHPDKNLEKRNTVLKKMYDLKKITKEEYEAAVASPLKLAPRHDNSQDVATSYFADAVVNDVISDLMSEKNYTKDFATRQVYNGGYKIYATVDPHVQSVMESVFEDTSNFPSSKAQSAMVVSDPYTGEIKGLIGGLGKKTDVRGWNRATQAVRPPGSSIKPLSVYGPGIDMGKITEMDVIKDEPLTIDKWTPKNSYSGYKGDMTVREAVARSSNIPAVKIMREVGISNAYGYLENKFHLTTLQQKDQNYASLSLGGLTNGVTVREMAAAYGVFVNRGKYIVPHTYTKVTDSLGNIILEIQGNETQALSESAAYITADLLSGPVNLPMGTATSAKLSTGMPAYGKTGTTDDNFDKWFVGFTPYYVGACWFGFDSPANLAKAGISGNPCLSVWKTVFDKLSAGQSYKVISKPSSVVEMNVCSISGKLPRRGCNTVKTYYVDGTQPKATCSNHYSNSDNDEEPESEDEPVPEDVTEAPSSEAGEGSGGTGGNNPGGNGGSNHGSNPGGNGGNPGNGGTTGGTNGGSTGGTTGGSTGGGTTGSGSGGSTGGSTGGETGGSTTGGDSNGTVETE